MANIRKHPKFEGIYTGGSKENPHILTLNADKGRTIYGEKLTEDDGKEYREWNPYRSKLAASIMNNCRRTFIDANSKVLYLGASSGTTVSHIADIVVNGIIYAVEFSPRSLRELVQNCVDRPNVIPILGDANRPFEYAKFVSTPIDLIYMDVAQPNQGELLNKNAEWFLKLEGNFIYAIKSRSIDTTETPTEIFKDELVDLQKAGFEVTDQIRLEPFTADHLVVFGRYKGKTL
jgi:fibrillarin-like pre-rRNA processing protein